MKQNKFDLKSIIESINQSYPNKYSERDFNQLIEYGGSMKNKRELISLVENLFDLDTSDAKDMVS